MRLLARWCYRHRIAVVLIWLAVLLGSMAIANSLGSAFSNSFSLPKAESTQAINLLRSVAPKNAGDREEIVFAVTPGHSIFDAGVQQSIDRALGKVAHLPHVTAVVSPFSREGHGQISANHQIAYATVTLDRLSLAVSVSQRLNLLRRSICCAQFHRKMPGTGRKLSLPLLLATVFLTRECSSP